MVEVLAPLERMPAAPRGCAAVKEHLSVLGRLCFFGCEE